MDSVIVARGFGKSFGSRSLWQDMSFQVQLGEIVALRGESGSGKTTFLNCLGGLEPSDGQLDVDGQSVNRLRGAARRRYLAETVTFLFQNYGLVDNWSVSRNLDLVQQRRSRAGFAGDKQAALRRVGLATLDPNDKVHLLSGGEQQRVALARASLKHGRVLLADEPTSALDDLNAARLVDVLQELVDGGATAVIATHDPRVLRVCSRQMTIGRLGGEDASAGLAG
jgi:putative ABC transport system ATP-binding protein